MPLVKSMNSKAECVRSFFSVPDRYLRGGGYNIRIRRETVQEFVQDTQFESILDIGCGDGSLSIPLLAPQGRLTLVDLSRSMLSIASTRIPAGLRKNVEIVNEEFMEANLAERGYDLILCVGVLAHVSDPCEVIAKMGSLAKPGASVIAEINDSSHFLSWIWRFYSKVRRALVPVEYALNAVSHRTLLRQFESRGFALAGIHRYSIALPGMRWILSQKTLYRGIRAIYGTSRCNRNGWLGNECLYHFRYLGKAPLPCDTQSRESAVLQAS